MSTRYLDRGSHATDQGAHKRAADAVLVLMTTLWISVQRSMDTGSRCRWGFVRLQRFKTEERGEAREVWRRVML